MLDEEDYNSKNILEKYIQLKIQIRIKNCYLSNGTEYLLLWVIKSRLDNCGKGLSITVSRNLFLGLYLLHIKLHPHQTAQLGSFFHKNEECCNSTRDLFEATLEISQ